VKHNTGDQEAATFIVRLWRESHVPAERESDWRGIAMHVQSGTERGFQGMESLVQFVQNWLESSPGDRED
jgi:hypothetical protein